jgi:hypothetical protein
MNTLLIIVLVLVAIAVVIILVSRARANSTAGGLPAPGQDPARRASVRGLRVGDVVNVEGHDCVVEQTLRFREGGYRWEEHLLVDEDWRRWLSVEDDEGLECALWERAPSPDLAPGPRELAVGGTTYRFEERGTADYTLERAGEPGSSGRVEYADYAAGDRLLGFERFGGGNGNGAWEISIGRSISPHALDVYPARDSA